MSADTVSDASLLRTTMVERLQQQRAILRQEVAAAFAAVPRHLFAPEATLEEAYDPEQVICTKWNPQGRAISSVSAAQIQARMIEQAGIRPGMRVLEIGSGGYNAAVLAEIVGPAGQVTTLDIDPEVSDRARRLLDEAGYPHVTVVRGDGELGCAEHAPFDAIMVTVEAADVPPAWVEQLVDGGTLTVPLRIRGLTRSLGFTRTGDRLVSTSKELCGFVPMQGAGQRLQQPVVLRGGEVTLRFDEEPCPVGAEVLEAAFAAGQAQAWTGVTARRVDTLQVWLSTTVGGACLLGVDKERDSGLLSPATSVMTNAAVDGSGFVYLATRKVDADTVELGAHAFGPDACALADRFAARVRQWDRVHRDGPGPRYTITWAGADAAGEAGGPVVAKKHVRISLDWP
ncbi:methyltransferase, FxLD system [Planomonospora sp. ID91781]|uniref:methyltransferase, FxLD system n=1 Tax=Planomonospora sp. ID91781 TaxID=2738135 RepID=UPI0018C41BDB|nr:methyltransferase, FxLD system [Planomonospora sp. ID91781]MBG0825678.1 methyltransferase, FxLD system [Planomonospora sp. ID91781]